MVYEAAAGPRTPSCQRRSALATARPRKWGGRELGGVRPGVLVPGQQPDGITDALRGLVSSSASKTLPPIGMIHVHLMVRCSHGSHHPREDEAAEPGAPHPRPS